MSPPETGQLELFHLERSSPASVLALLRLPEANARSFVIASALGRFFDHDGSFKEVRSLKEIGGSFVGLKQRGRVLRAATWLIAAGLVAWPCSSSHSWSPVPSATPTSRSPR